MTLEKRENFLNDKLNQFILMTEETEGSREKVNSLYDLYTYTSQESHRFLLLFEKGKPTQIHYLHFLLVTKKEKVILYYEDSGVGTFSLNIKSMEDLEEYNEIEHIRNVLKKLDLNIFKEVNEFNEGPEFLEEISNLSLEF